MEIAPLVAWLVLAGLYWHLWQKLDHFIQKQSQINADQHDRLTAQDWQYKALKNWLWKR